MKKLGIYLIIIGIAFFAFYFIHNNKEYPKFRYSQIWQNIVF